MIKIEWTDESTAVASVEDLAAGFGSTEAEAYKNLAEMLVEYIRSRWTQERQNSNAGQ